MRTALSLFCLLFLTTKFAGAQQQVPNGGFENWVYNNHYAAEVPQGAAGMNWVSGDSLMVLLCGWSQQPQVQKTTDAHSGTYALCLQESFYIAPVGGVVVEDNGGGYISLGNFDTATFKPLGVPYTEHPSALTGYYKLTADTSGADTANIRIGFRRNSTLTGQGGQLFYTTTTTYQPFTIPIDWNGTQNPTKLMLDMSVGATDMTCSDTSTRFYLDDLSFLFSNGVKESLFANEHISIYPNPATDVINIRLDDVYLDEHYYITVHDATGRIVSKIGQLKKEQQISLRTYGSGTYFIQLHNDKETIYGSKISVMQ